MVSESNDDSPSNTSNVSKAYITRCPSADSLSYPSHAVDRMRQQYFIAQSIISLFQDETIASCVSHEQETTEKAIRNFVQKSAVLENHLNRKYKNVFNPRKTARKDAYFRLLGYSALFASKRKPVDEALKIRRTSEMKEAYKKLFKLNCSETRDTSF